MFLKLSNALTVQRTKFIKTQSSKRFNLFGFKNQKKNTVAKKSFHWLSINLWISKIERFLQITTVKLMKKDY